MKNQSFSQNGHSTECRFTVKAYVARQKHSQSIHCSRKFINYKIYIAEIGNHPKTQASIEPWDLKQSGKCGNNSTGHLDIALLSSPLESMLDWLHVLVVGPTLFVGKHFLQHWILVRVIGAKLMSDWEKACYIAKGYLW